MIKASIDFELKQVVNISKKYGARKVYLFGSCVEDIATAHDIDIAVSGIPAKDFFKYYGDVSMTVKDEVDIVDLDEVSPHLYKRIISKGKVLYDRPVSGTS